MSIYIYIFRLNDIDAEKESPHREQFTTGVG